MKLIYDIKPLKHLKIEIERDNLFNNPPKSSAEFILWWALYEKNECGFEAQRIIDLRGMVAVPPVEVFAEAMCEEIEKININGEVFKNGVVGHYDKIVYWKPKIKKKK